MPRPIRTLTACPRFTTTRMTVTFEDGAGHVYRWRDRKLTFLSSFELHNRAALAVLPASGGEFAVFDPEVTGDGHRVGSTDTRGATGGKTGEEMSHNVPLFARFLSALMHDN